MAYLMGIDLGSTSIKAIVYDELGNAVSSGSRPTPLTYDNKSQPTWCVWEPQQIWNSVTAAVREAVSAVENAEDIKALAVTGFGMDGLPIGNDGAPLYPMISWHCPRTIPQFEEFSQRMGTEYLFKRTGKTPQAIDSIYRMIWMKENRPDVLEKTDKWLLIEDYVNFRLCGERATDYSMATTTSVFDQRTHSWFDDLIEKAGIPRSIFPEAYRSGRILGNVLPETAEETGLSPKTKVVLGGHDYICAALATGAIDPSTLLDITGTWEMLVLSTDSTEITDDLYRSGYYLEGHVAPDRCCYVGSTISGDMTEWMRKQLCGEERIIADSQGKNIWSLISDACEKSSAGSSGCMFLPHFSGACAPHFDPNSMGAFVGLHNPVTKQDMIRSVFEGLDYQFRLMMDTFNKYKLGNPQRIVTTGGAVNNSFWVQNKADVTGCRLEVPEIDEATPLGAAMTAGIGAGIYKDEYEAVNAVRRNVKVYEPNEEAHKLYDECYNDVYVKLQDALSGVNHELSRKFR
ncbi:MAG: hypothetical protein HUJ73_00430 [Eubacterium sp.]|nr:hypothetical protein [Eubacterium sp.]